MPFNKKQPEAKKTKHVALTVIPKQEGIVDDKFDQNVRTFYQDGVQYNVATEKPVEIPVPLAEDLKRKGIIKSFSVVER